MSLSFKKMHGLGNDFVIIDTRENGVKITSEQVCAIADRKRGVGCDQVILIERSKNWIETNLIRIYNPDGSETGACGNGTRCVADLLMNEDDVDDIVIETAYAALNCFRDENGLVRVEMGHPRLEWQDIPLSKSYDTLHLPLEGDPVGVNIGNPHCVFFIEKEMSDQELEKLGAHFEHDPLFPERTNVEFVEVLAKDHLRMRVWERGTGITQACGSGACASVVAAIRRGLSARKVTVTLDGGDLIIAWPDDNSPVSMTGPVAYVFDGRLKPL
ncbi:MAG: diaminopimelate epimerase [Alphaproteobacteria bacterium]|nr:diaminopimelate epimerase [Alphaproteobacteria bacterium]